MDKEEEDPDTFNKENSKNQNEKWMFYDQYIKKSSYCSIII